MNDWLITYIDYSGVLCSIVYLGSLTALDGFFLPNTTGVDSIMKIERIPEKEGV